MYRVEREEMQKLADKAGMLLVENEGGVLTFHEAQRPGLLRRVVYTLSVSFAAVGVLGALAFAGGMFAGVWANGFRLMLP